MHVPKVNCSTAHNSYNIKYDYARGGGTPSLYELYVGMYEAKLKGMVFEPFQSELRYRVLLFWSEIHSLSSGPKLRMLFRGN